MAGKSTISVKTMQKDKDGKPVEQTVFVRDVEGVEAVPAQPEVKAAPPKVVPMSTDIEVKPAVEAKEEVPESAIIKFRSGGTLHVAHSAKDVTGMLG